MFWKRKEKAIMVENMISVCEKTFYTQECAYMPIQIKTYQDRIEFLFNRICEGAEKPEELSGTALLSEERFLPFQLGDEILYWDTYDRAFRMRMNPEGEPEPLIPPVLFYPNEVMTMERTFAEKTFSALALSYATLKEDRYIWFYPDYSVTPVVFEAPRLFLIFDKIDRHPLRSNPVDVLNNLSTFTSSYLNKNDITLDNFIQRYKENMKKGKTEESV